jgi:hypothetical protein
MRVCVAVFLPRTQRSEVWGRWHRAHFVRDDGGGAVADSIQGNHALTRSPYCDAGPRLTRASSAGRIHLPNAVCTSAGVSAT